MLAVLLFMMVGTWYLAGMFHSLPLLLLSVAEALAVLVLGLLPVLAHWKLSARFLYDRAVATRGQDMTCRIQLSNTGPLPVSQVSLLLSVCYGQARRRRRWVSAGAPKGDSQAEFQLNAPCCGLLSLRLERLRAFDFLLFFSADCMGGQEVKVAVLPGRESLALSPRASNASAIPSPENQEDLPGDSGSEIRRFRIYGPGDSARHIHWKLSARTDELWVKEYYRESGSGARVLLDVSAPFPSPEEADGVYRLLSALVCGLLDYVDSVLVIWAENGKSFSAVIPDWESLLDLLPELYRTHLSRLVKEGGPAVPDDVYRLTAEPAVYRGASLLHRFSLSSLDKELEETVLPL